MIELITTERAKSLIDSRNLKNCYTTSDMYDLKLFSFILMNRTKYIFGDRFSFLLYDPDSFIDISILVIESKTSKCRVIGYYHNEIDNPVLISLQFITDLQDDIYNIRYIRDCKFPEFLKFSDKSSSYTYEVNNIRLDFKCEFYIHNRKFMIDVDSSSLPKTIVYTNLKIPNFLSRLEEIIINYKRHGNIL